MAVEIERKFLVTSDAWRHEAQEARHIRQGYLSRGHGPTVRIRTSNDKAFLTIKGPSNGVSQAEYEYPIPLSDAQEMLQTLVQGAVIEKTRHLVKFGIHTWEVDVFAGENDGLIVAEIELGAEDESFAKPSWVGADVTGDKRYRNAQLSVRPYRNW